MKLTIDTTNNEYLVLSLADSHQNLSLKVPAERRQSEKLLPSLEKFLAKQGLNLKSLTSIAVVNGQGTFSSLRIGIVTANALAYALGLPVSDTDGQSLEKNGIQMVAPRYNAEANIGPKASRAAKAA